MAATIRMQALRQFIILLFLTLLPFLASAMEVEVKVSERAADAVKAREAALETAQKRGFVALLKQKLSAEKADKIALDYTGKDLGRYVLGYYAKDEAVTDISYRGTMVVNFDDYFINTTINSALQRNGATLDANFATNANAATDDSFKPTLPEAYQNASAFQVPTSNATLVIPILKNTKDSETLLWQPNNLWRSEVSRAALQKGNGNFIVPYGDPKDQLVINADTADLINYARMVPMLQRYGASKVVIATATSQNNGDLDIQLRNLSANNETLSNQAYARQAASGTAELMLQAANEFITRVKSGTQGKTGLATSHSGAGKSHSINAYLALNSARDWSELRKRLRAIEQITNVAIVSAQSTGISLNLDFSGEPTTLGKALKQQGISAVEKNNQLLLGLR